jgi:endonuclease/exonuclease/phosphatase family metal-dependent hydrolase
MKLVGLRIGLCAVALMGVSSVRWRAEAQVQEYVRDSGPEMFTYDELVQLNLQKELSPLLAKKLGVVTTTPFVNNEAYLGGGRARPLDVPTLGPSLRVALWNIERGLELDDIILFLHDKDAFMAKVKEEREKAKEEKKRLRAAALEKVPEQIEILKAADVWILNEVDWGVKRTDYQNVARELGNALHMNWAYGVEFLEVAAPQLGFDKFDDGETAEEQTQLLEEFKVDKDKVRAMHGNAVLSRYPIRSAKLVPFTMGYDWYKETNIRPLEKVKRKAAYLVGEELLQETRRGQRTTLYVDLDVPEAPGGMVTIAATHLENRTKPKVRRQQMQELLNTVRDVNHPVIIGGDMNTTGTDSTPTSVENMLYKRYGSLDFWTTKGIQWTTGVGLVYSGMKAGLKLSGIQYRIDPTSANIPGASPNLERGFFTATEKFRFADGTAIDFRGVPERTVNGTSGTLADSNQRSGPGFVSSFVTELIWGKVKLAKFKLDWLFVKANIQDGRNKNASYVFAPHFARTMVDLNNCLPEPISDHSPMTVDLPFHEPQELKAKSAGTKNKSELTPR